MTLHGFVLFVLVYALASASPGPGIAAILARVLGRGGENVGAFIAGFVVGDLVWFTFAATGMAVLAQTAHLAFTIVKYAGAVYLLYLACRAWTAPAQSVADLPEGSREGAGRTFLGGLALTMGNPKVMVFFLALLPTVIDLRTLTFGDFLKVALTMSVILTTVLSAYALAALRTRRFFRSPRAVKWLNRGSGTVMAGAAVAVATRT